MNTSIWKFKLNGTGLQTIEMPSGAGILSVQVINNTTFIYALVNTEAETTEERNFVVYGTGNSFGDDDGESEYRFVGTYTVTKLSDDTTSVLSMVGHVFEIVPIAPTKANSDDDGEDEFAALNLSNWEDFKETEDYQIAQRIFNANGINTAYTEFILKAAFDAGFDA